MNSVSETVNDEVTFLLRLRPTPFPRIRRKCNNANKRCEANSQSATSNGWNIAIEPNGTCSPGSQRKDLNVTASKPTRKRFLQLSNILKKKDVGRPIDWEASLEVPSLTECGVLPTAPPQEELEETVWYYPQTVLMNGSKFLARSDELSYNKSNALCETNILFTDINWCSPEFNVHEANTDTSRAEVANWSFQNDSNKSRGVPRNNILTNNCILDQQRRSRFGITRVGDTLKVLKTARSESALEVMVSGFVLELS